MKKLLIALTACSTLALAGCGDSEPKAAAEPSALTKAEFIKQADAICAASEARLDKLGDEISENTSMEEIQTFLEKQVVPELSSTVEKVHALEPPKADAEQVDEMLDALEAEVAKAKKDPMTIMGDDAFANANKLAADYGLKTCSE
jgi:nitrous oxide reductase accessory protein NosL